MYLKSEVEQNVAIIAELPALRLPWTGIAPNGPVSTQALPNLKNCTRKEVFDYFSNGWLLTEILFTSLKSEKAFTQPPPHGLRHPLIFYYGHTAALFVNKLRVANLIVKTINPYFERIFEVGVDEMSWDDMSKNEMGWPNIADVTEFRRKAFDLVVEVIATHPGLEDGHSEITSESQLWALFMGFEHERIHFETSSVLIREMPIELIKQPYIWPQLPDTSSMGYLQDIELVSINSAVVALGKPKSISSYGWDNEYGARQVKVQPFEISKYMITNKQYLEFVEDNGYSKPEFWTDEGWRWKCYQNTKKPTFWVYSGPQGLHSYKLRTLFSEIALPLDWPVCVNFHEAKAYLAWLSKREGRAYRLPTEAEHVYLRRETHDSVSGVLDTANCRDNLKANLCLAYGSEAPVSWSKPNIFGVHDIAGNLWDWCEDDFNPLEGFNVHSYYEDFSTPCFDGEHSMMLGGSFISTGDEASEWARFHFRRHFFQHAGFHAVVASSSSAVKINTSASKYDDKKVLDQYLLFHYGSADVGVPENMQHAAKFPQRTAHLLIAAAKKHNCGFENVLDVGCAVGGASFELAKHYKKVTGVDISEQFVHTANDLNKGISIPYNLVIEGDILEKLECRVQLPTTEHEIQFRRADACSLPTEFVGFDAVLASNLLDRLPSPRSFLNRLGGVRGLVKPGGIVVLGSPFTWSTQYTPKASWLGANNETDHTLSFDNLREIMSADFELVLRENVPFMIREHIRKYEYVISDFSIWIRKST